MADMRRVSRPSSASGLRGLQSRDGRGPAHALGFEANVDEIYEATRDQLMQNLRMELQQAGMNLGAVRGLKRRRAAVRAMLAMQTHRCWCRVCLTRCTATST
ncbi:MAG: hypothetical protein ACLTDR_14920 [Adlercreutzia equolifaciens]